MKATEAIKTFCKRHIAIIALFVAIIIAGANYLLYPTFIKNDMQIIEIPVLVEKVTAGTQITTEMLDTYITSKDMIPATVVLNKEDVIGKYVKSNYTIDANTFISLGALSTEKDTLGQIYYRLNNDEFAYTIKVATLSNADKKLKVGQYVDIFYYERINTVENENDDLKAEDIVRKELVGVLDNAVKIVNVASNDDSSIITVAINEEDIAYYIIASKLGELTPMVSTKSKDEHTLEKYDETIMRDYLDSKSNILKVNEIPEELILEEGN